MFFERFFQLLHVLAIPTSSSCIFATIAERCECAKHRMQEPPHPDALALAEVTDAIHAIIPVTRTHQRQTVRTHVQAPINSTQAMFKDCRRLAGYDRLQV